MDLENLSKDKLIKLLLQEKQKVSNLTDEVSLLRKYLFAKKSEKTTEEDKRQGYLFTEIEDTSDEAFEEVKKPTAPKKKPGRKPLPSDIPREKVIYDLNKEEKKCPCCSKPRPLIASKPTEELEFIPAKIVVKEHHTLKYGACSCKGFQESNLPEVITAKTPGRLIPGGIASPNLIAHIITNKFCDHSPLYRQERIFNRIGVNISRQNMSNWALTVAQKCEPVIDYMKKVSISGNLINMDETTVQVLNEKNRKNDSKSYMWVLTGGNKDKKVVLYNYSQTRNQEIPLKLLEGYSGILQTDGYSGYNKAVKEYGLWHVGCLAHARRKFYQVSQLTKKKGKAHKGVNFFSRLYEVDRKLRDNSLSPEEFLKKRRELSIPIWKEFYTWLKKLEKIISPDSPLSRAVKYSLNQYKNLVRYLKYPEISLDNNICENAIRPFCVGRKNWLFSNSPKGAYSSATFYSLIETAKVNGKEPGEYLSFLFNRLSETTPETDFETLMPWNMPQVN